MPKAANHQLVSIIIPIYKNTIDEDELLSLKQCVTILGKYPITFVAPLSLDMAGYIPYLDTVNYTIKRFDDHFFKNIRGYNALMLNVDFYKQFQNFSYVLIYQLDACVFRDELTMWCNKGYDYIGAPYIFCDLDTYPVKVLTKYRKLLKLLYKFRLTKYKFRHVGNGGLSLRNVKKTIFILSVLKGRVKKWPHNEDSFFTYYGNVFFWLFKLAPEELALQFSFEDRPDQAYKINNYQLPFGCHAWSKYGRTFWMSHINKADG